MYEFCYHILNPFSKEKIQLLRSDTDSFVLRFDTNDKDLKDCLKQIKMNLILVNEKRKA